MTHFIGREQAEALLGKPTGPPASTTEPPIGTVIKFKVALPDGQGSTREYDYAGLRAGNGLWYLTGGAVKQGVSWTEVVEHIKPHLQGPVFLMAPQQGIWL